MIPNNLLLQISPTTFNLKVYMYVSYIFLTLVCMYVYYRAAAIPPRASRHLSLWGFLTIPAYPYSFFPQHYVILPGAI